VGGVDDLLLPPGQLVVVAAQCLLPPELHHRADQAEPELAVPPRRRVDAVTLQRRAVGVDRLLLAGREASAVDGEVPRQVARRRAHARQLPVEQDRAALAIGAEVVELPVAVDERRRRPVERGEQRRRVVDQR
jgi:hypothetical protein